MLVHRLRRYANIKPTSGQWLVRAGCCDNPCAAQRLFMHFLSFKGQNVQRILSCSNLL